MKQIFLILKDYITKNFEPKLYLLTAIWLVIIFSINYHFDLEDSHVDKIKGFWNRVGGHFAFQFIPYIIPVFFIAFLKNISILKSKQFWLKAFVAFFLLAFYRSLYFYPEFCKITPLKGCVFQYKILIKFCRLILLLIPLLIFYHLDKKHLQNFYGLTTSFKSIKMYLPLLAIMSVLIFIACQFESIQKYYPLYLKSGGDTFARVNELPQCFSVLLFESTYMFNFISIEYFFRGFFVLSFVRILGPQVILPTLCLYATIHFGKPFLEAFSSIFGAYILGVLTLKTENIWGGIFVHAGIAGIMELFAYLI